MPHVMTLELLICTHNERIHSASELLLPEMPQVRYLVAWQCTTPDALDMPVPQCMTDRKDVQVVRTATSGLSVNRNIAMEHATGDLLLIADDDCRYRQEQLLSVIQAYADHPEADIITFRMDDMDGALIKDYPTHPFEWTSAPRGSYICSWEISCRNKPTLPHFDTHFGIGAPLLGCAEEEVWMHDAVHGTPHAKALYLPITIGCTPSGTTGTRFLEDEAVQRAKGAMIRILHKPLPAGLRIFKTALLAPLGIAGRWNILCQMVYGARLISRWRKL